MSASAPISKHYSKTVKSQQLNKAWQQFELMRREVKQKTFEHPWFLVSSNTKFSQGRFTDTVLVADGKRFPAHKLVLCSCSPYFDRMFQVFFRLGQNFGHVYKVVFRLDFWNKTVERLSSRTLTRIPWDHCLTSCIHQPSLSQRTMCRIYS